MCGFSTFWRKLCGFGFFLPKCAGLGFFYSFRVEKAKDQKNVDVIGDKDSRRVLIRRTPLRETAVRLRGKRERDLFFPEAQQTETQRDEEGDCVV